MVDSQGQTSAPFPNRRTEEILNFSTSNDSLVPKTGETAQAKFLFHQVAERVGDMRPSLIGLRPRALTADNADGEIEG